MTDSTMPRNRRPRVLLADDYQRLLDAWRRLLEPAYDVVGSVSTGHDVVAAARTLQPDVVVLDVGLPDVNGLEACRLIKEATPGVGVILVTAADDVDVRQAAFEAGASAFVLKYSPGNELEEAIQRACLDRAGFPTAGQRGDARPTSPS